MIAQEYKQWVNQLPKLSVAQLNDLSTRIKLLANSAGKEHIGKSSFGDRLLSVLCDVMKKHNVETPSISSLRKSTAFTQSKGKIDDLQVFFETISKSKLVQDSILKVAINLMYHDLLQWKGVAISSHTMLKQIHRIPSTIHKSFPGYAASGMLTKLVKGA